MQEIDSMDRRNKMIIQGFGEIGQLTAIQILADPSLELAGVVDPAYKGMPLENILKGVKPGIVIKGDAEEVFREIHPDALVLTTSSKYEDVAHQLYTALAHRVKAVVTSSEGMFYLPSDGLVGISASNTLDFEAKRGGTSVIGTGINPGAVMDMWVLKEYERQGLDYVKWIKVIRSRDTKDSRQSLQEKVGTGRAADDDGLSEFYVAAMRGKIGHVGLEHCGIFLADRIFGEGSYTSKMFLREPVIATKTLTTKCGIKVVKGETVAGLHECCRLYFKEGNNPHKEKITLDLYMFAGAEDLNCIEIYGMKDGKDKHSSATFDLVGGDLATAIILADAVNYALKLGPGYHQGVYCPPYEKVRAR